MNHTATVSCFKHLKTMKDEQFTSSLAVIYKCVAFFSVKCLVLTDIHCFSICFLLDQEPLSKDGNTF